MLSMAMEEPGRPLQAVWRASRPEPAPGQLLVEVLACGVCRTDLHLVDGDLPFPGHPIVPGHEIVGRVVAIGEGVSGRDDVPHIGDRVGVPWLGWTCGTCEACRAGRENLCRAARFTGWQIAGGYATHAVADARYAFALPGGYDDAHAAPLLCAGLIGYRACRQAPDARRLGLYGFGAAAHLIAQVAVGQGREVFALTRPGDASAQDLARALGAAWAGGSDETPPAPLDAALIFAPDGRLVPAALRAVRPGGTVVCAGIHMSDIPSFPYAWLWEERRIVSVANLTRTDAREFLALAGTMSLDVRTVPYPLEAANQALDDLRAGRFSGAAVLVPPLPPSRPPS
jgi:propanol-preferring alcohol dehydrogenase